MTPDRLPKPPSATEDLPSGTLSVWPASRDSERREQAGGWGEEIAWRRGESRAFRLPSTGARPAARRKPRLVSEGGGLPALSAPQWTCAHDSLPRGEVRIDLLGTMLVVWKGKPDQRASL